MADNSHRLKWHWFIRKLLKMDAFGGLPEWWQWFVPRYKNYGGVGWSAKRWLKPGDPTDWGIEAANALDELYKQHDMQYRPSGSRSKGDDALIDALPNVEVNDWYGRIYGPCSRIAFQLKRRFEMRKKMNWVAFFVGVFVAFVIGGITFAGDVPTISPQDFSLSPEAHWFWSLLGSSVVAAIIAAAGKLAQSLLSGIKNARLAEGCQIVYDATISCYHEYVRGIKAGNADGKLTLEEKNEALQWAYRKAIEIAQARGIDLLKVLAKETIFSLIERYVGESKAVVAPLPDLGPSALSV